MQKKGEKREKSKKAEPVPFPEESPGLLDDDFESYDRRAGQDDNPFKELENLITDKAIDVKTFLTDRQVVLMHKLETLKQIYEDAGDSEGAAMIRHFSQRFMTLIINKDGLSRSQFIEAIGRGRERAEEAKREKLQQYMGGLL